MTLLATFFEISRISSSEGYTLPSSRSFWLNISGTASAAASSIPSLTILASTSLAPSARPGNTYMLLLWLDATMVPSGILTSACGLPLAKIARPPHACCPSLAVHSILCVGFDMGNRIGLSWCLPNSSSTSDVNRPPTPVRPSNTRGLFFLTTSNKRMPSSSTSFLANFATCEGRFGRFCVIRPSASTIKNLPLASSSLIPKLVIAVHRKSVTPIPALPAPHTTKTRSLSSLGLRLHTLRAPYNPASAVAAVPWMSSLNMRWWLR
mmetsp:Transcript_28549/g.55556  ORF Transcript_28549/g.55556 Transcript_28549/m.55556 type:complete len:265 (-) Transcript_28549:169-963(-)